MYTFRLNLSTNEVEILEDGFVKLAIPKIDFNQFSYGAWKAAKNPSQMRRVRDLIDITLK